jgi:phenylalanyl-tRNA synthetase alpha chain
MLEQLETIYQTALAELKEIRDSESLQAWESKYIGRKGEVTLMLRQTGKLAESERANFGKRANEIKNLLVESHTEQEKTIRAVELGRFLEEGEIDVTLPGRTNPIGGLHPTTRTIREILSVWADMGFQVYRSREVESDEMNFTMLNIPPHHPARDMHDTFYTTQQGVILRTHTSPGQIRSMHALGENGTKPIRVVLPGMCFRFEQIDATHEIQFTQIEGLAVGKNIRMTDLKGTIADFVRRMYGQNAQVRYRASYFPFTEPSMEVDVLGANGNWLEIMGCGMVHPTVLRNGGYDPAVYSGFAFGMGPERIAILRHKITDIRYFWQNDLRFLEQF